MITFSKVVSRNEGVPDFIDLTSTNQNVPLVIFFFVFCFEFSQGAGPVRIAPTLLCMLSKDFSIQLHTNPWHLRQCLTVQLGQALNSLFERHHDDVSCFSQRHMVQSSIDNKIRDLASY